MRRRQGPDRRRQVLRVLAAESAAAQRRQQHRRHNRQQQCLYESCLLTSGSIAPTSPGTSTTSGSSRSPATGRAIYDNTDWADWLSSTDVGCLQCAAHLSQVRERSVRRVVGWRVHQRLALTAFRLRGPQGGQPCLSTGRRRPVVF